MASEINTPLKHVLVEPEVHAQIKAISALLRASTRSPHPGYVVVRMAISLLNDELGIAYSDELGVTYSEKEAIIPDNTD